MNVASKPRCHFRGTCYKGEAETQQTEVTLQIFEGFRINSAAVIHNSIIHPLMQFINLPPFRTWTASLKIKLERCFAQNVMKP